MSTLEQPSGLGWRAKAEVLYRMEKDLGWRYVLIWKKTFVSMSRLVLPLPRHLHRRWKQSLYTNDCCVSFSFWLYTAFTTVPSVVYLFQNWWDYPLGRHSCWKRLRLTLLSPRLSRATSLSQAMLQGVVGACFLSDQFSGNQESHFFLICRYHPRNSWSSALRLCKRTLNLMFFYFYNWATRPFIWYMKIVEQEKWGIHSCK